jgi:ABC-type transport system substrate-binding protein
MERRLPRSAEFPQRAAAGTAKLNNGGYSNLTLDRLTREADTIANDDARRYRLYNEAEKIALRDAAWILLDWAKAEILIRPFVHGLVLTGLGLVAPNWADVTIQ